jgi:hypothetical protein
MNKPAAGTAPRDEGEPYRTILQQIHASALSGLERANAELTRADEEEDDERWSQWRGYRQAVLEVLAITDRLELPEIGVPLKRPDLTPPESGESQQVHPA